MAVAHDAYSFSGLPTTDPSWTHTPVGTPRGVLVIVIQDGGTAETVSCTYGGTAMTALTPIDGSGASEPARIYPFFLGASVPTGAQTVAVTDSGTQTKIGVAYTVTAADDTEVDAENSLVSSSQDDPTVNLTTSDTTLTYGAVFSGLGNSANVTADANHTKDLSASTVGDSMNSEHRSAAVAAGTVAVGFVTSAADDVVLYAVAIKEASGATAYDLDCQPGSVAVTGAAASPLAARMTAALAGAFAVTGTAASPVAGRAVNAAPGSYAVTGAAATPVAARTINAATGAYTVTGDDAGTLAGRALNAAPGVYTLTGVEAELLYTPAPGEYLLDCQPGSITVTGAAATVGRTLTLSADPAGYSVTGNAATFGRTFVLTASPGSFVLTGVAAELALQVQEPTLDPVLTGWIATPVPGRPGGGTQGRIRVPSSGSIA